MKYLIDTSNSNSIKVYCILMWLLWDNKKKCYEEKQITYNWLCKQLGLSTNSKKNLETIGDILFVFNEVGLIERRKEMITEEKKGYNTTVKTVYYYTLVSTEDFLKNKNNYNK